MPKKKTAAPKPTSAGRGKSHSLEVGKSYFFRSITFHYLGRVEGITDTDVILGDASWVADPYQRLGEFLSKGPTPKAEIEPYPDGTVIQRDGLIDWSPWSHALPKVASPS